ncbi:MAG: phenylacetate--CoA ligase family protein [Kofleriaceae bacterium]
MPSLLDRIYARSPIVIQNVMATGYGLQQQLLRHRGRYDAFVAELDRQQWFDADALQELQDRAVRRMVTFAAREVPYYRELFASARIDPEDIRGSTDLRHLPYTTKETVQEHAARLRPDRLRIRAVAQTTGGTTGRPVSYWVTPDAIQFNYATYETRFRRWAGVELGDRMVSINGKPIVPMTQAGPPYWRTNLAFNQLYVSAYHLSDTTIPSILERVEDFAPRVIVAYASAVHRIARFINESGITHRIRPAAILVSSETLFDAQRADLEHAFHCKVYNGYSLGEPVCFISECAHGGMHVSPEFGVVEMLEGPDGHEIVATGLINDAMPLLRYRTGDLANPVGAPCRCGRALPTIGAIIGRIDDMVSTPEGAQVGPAALSLAFQSVPNLIESQIVQDSIDAITLRIVASDSFTPANERFLLAELRKRLGLQLRIDLQRVAAIPRTVSGKHRLIVSSLRGKR